MLLRLLLNLAMLVSFQTNIFAQERKEDFNFEGYRLYRTADGGYGYDREGKYFFWHRSADGVEGYDGNGKYFRFPR